MTSSNSSTTSSTLSTATTRTVADAAAEPVRLHADHNSLKRLGNWTSAERFEVRARRGSVVLDLRSPQLPAGELVVDLDLDRSMVKLLLPDDAIVDQWDLVWTGSGKVKDGVGQHNARKGEVAEGARRVRLTGRVHSGVARGGRVPGRRWTTRRVRRRPDRRPRLRKERRTSDSGRCAAWRANSDGYEGR